MPSIRSQRAPHHATWSPWLVSLLMLVTLIFFPPFGAFWEALYLIHINVAPVLAWAGCCGFPLLWSIASIFTWRHVVGRTLTPTRATGIGALVQAEILAFLASSLLIPLIIGPLMFVLGVDTGLFGIFAFIIVVFQVVSSLPFAFLAGVLLSRPQTHPHYAAYRWFMDSGNPV